MARTEDFSAEQVAKALRESRGLVSVAAQKLGCTSRTVRNYKNRYVSVEEAAVEARNTLIDTAEQNLADKVEEKDMTAIIFTLKTLGKSRGYVERSEFAGVPDQPLEVVVTWGKSIANTDG